jgi:general secretion pathway protein G
MLLRAEYKNRRRSAFTLMEMLIVVAIIVALAGISIFTLVPMYQGAQKDTARAKAKAIGEACTAYYIKHQAYPTQVDQLTQKDEFGGPYLKAEGLLDPWGKKYNLAQSSGKTNDGSPEISTTAPDGTVIGNWSEKQN